MVVAYILLKVKRPLTIELHVPTSFSSFEIMISYTDPTSRRAALVPTFIPQFPGNKCACTVFVYV